MTAPAAFYLPDGDAFVPTELTRGPWSPDAQHAGPPAALLGRAIERLDPVEMRVARFTMEILRPVPISPARVEARVDRPGRRVQHAVATLSDEEGPIASASAWRILPGESEPVDLEPTPHDGPSGSEGIPPFAPHEGESYFTAMEWRLAAGSVLEPGPAAVWMRMRHPLLPGEEPSPLTRVLAAADSGNGISWVLPLDRWLFVNTELTVHLARVLAGEWVCLDARTRVGPEGVGFAETDLWDERGRIGRGAQALLIAARD